MLVTSDRPLWLAALQTLVRDKLRIEWVRPAAMEPAALNNVLRWEEPNLALVAAGWLTQEVKDGLQLLRDGRLRCILIAPRAVMPRFADLIHEPEGVLAEEDTTADLERVVHAVRGGELPRPALWPQWRSQRSAKLTNREQEVFERLVRGLSLRDVADQMGVKFKTAESYRANVFRKMGVRNRVELAVQAMQRGLIRV